MRVPLKGGVSVRTVMKTVRQLAEGLDGYEGSHVPTNPQGTGQQSGSVTPGLVSPGSPSTHITDEGPLQEWGTGTVGHRSSWDKLQLSLRLLRTRVGQDGPDRTNAVSTECQPPSSRMVSITCFPLPPYSPEKATLAPSGRGHEPGLAQFRGWWLMSLSSGIPLSWKHYSPSRLLSSRAHWAGRGPG